MTTRAPMRNWAGNVTFGAARVHRPDTVDELRRLVAGSARIRAVGTGHSFSRVADSTGYLVRLDGLPAAITVDPATSTATVGGGIRYAEAAAAIDAAGYALANLASLPHISVAGSVATGTHGSGDTLRSLAAAVAAVEFVGPDGDLVRLARGDAGFDGAVVALGALGVVTALTLDVEPAYAVAQTVRLDVPLDEVAGRFDEVFGAAYSVSAFTDWHGGHASVWLKQRADRPGTGWSGGRAAPGPVHPVPGMPTEATTTQGGVPGAWHTRLPHFRADLTPSAGAELQSEFFLPRAAAPAAIAAVRGIAAVVAPVLHISEIRTVRGDDLWLSPAYRRDSVALHFTWVDDAAAVAPALAAVEERLLPLGARPHWGKLTTAVPSAAGYPRAGDFAALVAAGDPAGKFANAYVEAVLGPVTATG